eukprot:gene28495-34401_t
MLLTVEVEDEGSSDRWSAEFTSQYIEEITHKAGNFKKFSLFVKMLSSAFQKTNESIFVDLLTFSDLEILKARKTGQNMNTSMRSHDSQQSSNHLKRYIILTYTSEFDRVHYPLPLAFEDKPNIPALKRTIARLRSKLKSQAEKATEPANEREKELNKMLHALRQENTELKHRLRQHSQRSASKQNTSTLSTESDHGALLEANRKLRRDVEELSRQLHLASQALETAKVDANKQIAKYKLLAYNGAGSQPGDMTMKGSKGSKAGGEDSKLILELQQRVYRLTQELKLERLSKGLPSRSPAPLPPNPRRSISAGSQGAGREGVRGGSFMTPPPRRPAQTPRSRSASPSTYMQGTVSSGAKGSGTGGRRYDSPLSTASQGSRGSKGSKGGASVQSGGSKRSAGSRDKSSRGAGDRDVDTVRKSKAGVGQSHKKKAGGSKVEDRAAAKSRSPSRLRGSQVKASPSPQHHRGVGHQKENTHHNAPAPAPAFRGPEQKSGRVGPVAGGSMGEQPVKESASQAQGNQQGVRKVLAMQSLIMGGGAGGRGDGVGEIDGQSVGSKSSKHVASVAPAPTPASVSAYNTAAPAPRYSQPMPPLPPQKAEQYSHVAAPSAVPVTSSVTSLSSAPSAVASSGAPVVEDADIQDIDKRIKALNQYLERARRGLGVEGGKV